MLKFLSNAWALLLGLLLLMIGNGLQGTLLGVRGEIEGFSSSESEASRRILPYLPWRTRS